MKIALTSAKGPVTSGPVFCLLLGASSSCARPITGQITSVTWPPVIGWAQSELTPSKRQKTGPDRCMISTWCDDRIPDPCTNDCLPDHCITIHVCLRYRVSQQTQPSWSRDGSVLPPSHNIGIKFPWSVNSLHWALGLPVDQWGQRRNHNGWWRPNIIHSGLFTYRLYVVYLIHKPYFYT